MNACCCLSPMAAIPPSSAVDTDKGCGVVESILVGIRIAIEQSFIKSFGVGQRVAIRQPEHVAINVAVCESERFTKFIAICIGVFESVGISQRQPKCLGIINSIGIPEHKPQRQPEHFRQCKSVVVAFGICFVISVFVAFTVGLGQRESIDQSERRRRDQHHQRHDPHSVARNTAFPSQEHDRPNADRTHHRAGG